MLSKPLAQCFLHMCNCLCCTFLNSMQQSGKNSPHCIPILWLGLTCTPILLDRITILVQTMAVMCTETCMTTHASCKGCIASQSSQPAWVSWGYRRPSTPSCILLQPQTNYYRWVALHQVQCSSQCCPEPGGWALVLMGVEFSFNL